MFSEAPPAIGALKKPGFRPALNYNTAGVSVLEVGQYNSFHIVGADTW